MLLQWHHLSIMAFQITFNFTLFYSLAPGKSEHDSKNVIFNLVLLIGIFRSSHDNVLWWMPQDLTDDKSTLVQVMAWCHQATSHYLSQCWLSSLLPYGVARPQWVINSFFRLIIKNASRLCIIGHLWGNPPVTDGFPSQRASNVESVSMSPHHLYTSASLLFAYWS